MSFEKKKQTNNVIVKAPSFFFVNNWNRNSKLWNHSLSTDSTL